MERRFWLRPGGRAVKVVCDTRFHRAYLITLRRSCYLDPIYDQIRNDPRFRKFLMTIGFADASVRVRAYRAAHPEMKAQ